MILLSHIVIAVASMVYSAYMLIFPAKAKFGLAYGFIGLTIATGTYLILAGGAHILQTCLSGLLYLGVSIGGLMLTRQRLAHERQKSE